jgi:hypothetical protein
MASFKEYNPQVGQQKSILRACEACYTRKVRCDTGGRTEPCSNCISHGVECKARSRKRKASSICADVQAWQSRTPHAPCTELRDQRDVTGNNNHNFTPIMTAPFLSLTYQPSPAPASSPDAFHNSSYLSRSAILGEDFPGIDHSHTNGRAQTHSLSESDLQVLEIYHALDLPDPPVRQSLLEAFIEYAWTWMPVTDLSLLSCTDGARSGSLLLLQAVLLVGMLMRPEVCDKEMVEKQYQRVKALINTGYERSPLNLLAALCLMQWYTSTAPNDLSTDTPRFWANYAAGLAQQVGLHRPSTNPHDEGDSRLRRRIWWTLCTRDNLMASAHGRPRMLNPADSTVPTIDLNDFENPQDQRAIVFVAYVKVVQILGDLCELLRRHGHIDHVERAGFISRLEACLSSFPEQLHLLDSKDSFRAYDLDIAQLHIPIMVTLTILHRPRSIFALRVSNAESITAAHLGFRLFEAIHLRNHTRLLSSAFAWHLLAVSIPHLSALRFPELEVESNQTMDALEKSLSLLGTVRPAAVNNLRNIRAIRRAVLGSSRTQPTRRNTPELTSAIDRQVAPSSAHIFRHYGPSSIQYHERVISILKGRSNTNSNQRTTAEDVVLENFNTVQSCSGAQCHSVNLLSDNDVGVSVNDAQDLFTALFGPGLQDNSWMRDWMEDLHLPPE